MTDHSRKTRAPGYEPGRSGMASLPGDAIPGVATISLWTSGDLYSEGKSVLLETGRFLSEF